MISEISWGWVFQSHRAWTRCERRGLGVVSRLLHDVGKKMEQGDKQKPSKTPKMQKRWQGKFRWQQVYDVVYKKIMAMKRFLASTYFLTKKFSEVPVAGWYPRACHLRVRKHRCPASQSGPECRGRWSHPAIPRSWGRCLRLEFHWKGVMVGWKHQLSKRYILKCRVFLGMKLVTYMAFVWDCDNFVWFLILGSCLWNQTRNLNVEVLWAINQIQTKTVSMKSTVSVSEFNIGYQMHFTEWIETTLTWLGFLSSFFAIWCFVSQDAAQTWQNRWRRQSMEVYAEVEIQKLKWHWSHRGLFLCNLLNYADKPSSLSWNHFWNNLSSWFLWCFFQCSADFSSCYPHLNLPAVLPSKDPEAPIEAAPAESRGSWARSSCGGVAVKSALQTAVDFGNVLFAASTRCFKWFEDVR